MADNKLQFTIEVLLKNAKALDNIVKQLKEQHGINIDTSELDSAISNAQGELDGLSGTDVEIGADGSQAESEAENVESAVDEIPEEHNTEIKASGGNALQTMAQLSMAYSGFMQVANQVTGAVKKLVDVYQIQEKADADLKSALSQHTNQSEKYLDVLKKEASAIQKVTIVGDEQSEKIMTAGLNMGISIDKIGDATRGSIGLAKQFEAVGLSQETAMKGLALAYQGDFTQLQRYIPALRSAGSESEKMAILQKSMANGFKQATDEAKTQTGQLKQLQNEMGDLQEEIGSTLEPALLRVKSSMMKVTKSVMDFLHLSDFKGQEEHLRKEAEYTESIKSLTDEQLQQEKQKLDNDQVRLGNLMHIWQGNDNIMQQLSAQNAALVMKKKILDEILLKDKDSKDINSKTKDDITDQNKALEDQKNIVADIFEIKKLSPEVDNDMSIEMQQLENEMLAFYNDVEAMRERHKQFISDQDQTAYKQEMTAIDEFYAQKHDAMKAAGYSEDEITEEIEGAKDKIRIKYANRALAGTSRLLGSLAGVMKKQGKKGFEAYKAMSIAQAIIDTYKAANSAYASLAGIPVVGPALGAAAAGAAVASGIMNVNTIRKEKYKAAKGAMIGGKPHSQGGTLIEAEKDEIILTKGVSKNPVLRSMANALNIAGGGDNITGDGSFMAGGGTASSSSNLTGILQEINNNIKAMNENIVSGSGQTKIIIENKNPDATVRQIKNNENNLVNRGDDLSTDGE